MPMKNVNFELEISMKNVFFIKLFSGLHYNANTFWIIQRMWKVFIVVSRAVNDTSGSAHVIHHSLKLQVIVKFRYKISMQNVFLTTFFYVLHDIVNIFCVTKRTWKFYEFFFQTVKDIWKVSHSFQSREKCYILSMIQNVFAL